MGSNGLKEISETGKEGFCFSTSFNVLKIQYTFSGKYFSTLKSTRKEIKGESGCYNKFKLVSEINVAEKTCSKQNLC